MIAIKLKSITRWLGIFGICIFFLLCGFEILPLLPNNTLDTFRLLGQQRSLDLRMIKDSFILNYRPPNEHAEALDELQKSLPAWEATQSNLVTNTQLPTEAQSYITQSQYDYSSMNQVFQIIIKNPTNINPLQMQILVDHSDPYFLEISQALNATENHIAMAAETFFLIELVLEIILFVIWIYLVRLELSTLKELLKKELEHVTFLAQAASSSANKPQPDTSGGDSE